MNYNIIYAWKILSKNQQFYFTSNAHETEIDGQVYKPVCFNKNSAVEKNSGLSIDNMVMEMTLQDLALTSKDVFSGMFEDAEVQLMQSVNAEGFGVVFAGFIESLSLRSNIVTFQIKSHLAKLNTAIGQVYSQLCRAEFGDHQCKKTIPTDSSSKILCDKTLAACKKHNNVVNFRGEPMFSIKPNY